MLPAYPDAVRRAFARNVVRNGLRVGRGEDVLIESWSATLPWAVSLGQEAAALGARPLLSVRDEEAFWRNAAGGPGQQLGRVGEHEWAALKASDAYINLWGPMDVAREEALPPAAARRVEATNHELMRVIQKYGIRSVRWDLGRTSPVWARRYGVSLEAWRRELIDAALVDPAGMRRDGARVADRLRRGRELRITHPNGTDLSLRLARRRPRVDDGVIDERDVREGNVMMIVPAGVTSVTVDEARGEGTIVSNASGVLFARSEEIPLPPGRWTFADGWLTELDRGAAGRRLGQALAALGHPRLRPGQISVGLNPRISTIPLLFDQGRGTITLEIGRNVMLGGRTRTPHLFAYFDLQGGSLSVDDELLVDRGHLVGR